MRVAMVTTQWAEIGGVENVVREISKELISKGHEVILITRNREANKEGFEEFFNDVIVVPNSKSYFGYLKNSRKIFKDLKEKVDVFHFHNWSTIMATIGIDLNSILTLHGTSYKFAKEEGKYIRAVLYWFIEEIACNLPDVLTSLTEYHLKLIKTLKKTVVIPNGVNTSKYNPKEYNKQKLRRKFEIEGIGVLTVGRLVKDKGHKYLLKAAKDFDKKSTILIPSDGPEADNLEELGEKVQSKTKHKIKFFGRVSKETLLELYGVADLFIMPTLSEGLPLVLLEAMSFELPIIATDVGGIKEVVEPADCGYIIEPRKPKEIAEKVNTLDKEKRESLGEKGRDYAVKNLDWSKMGEDYIKIYREII